MRTLFIILFGVLILNTTSFTQQEEVYCRFQWKDKINYGKVEGKEIHILDKAPWQNGKETGQNLTLDKVKLLNPSEPSLIIGLSKSYKESWKGKTPPKNVRWFIKPPTAAGAPGDDIVIPPSFDAIKVEVEMVIVIGKKVKNADEAEARDAIFGYTTGNDVVGTVDSYHKVNGEQADLAENVLATGLKISDGFEPFGPFIHRNMDWKNRERIMEVINSVTGEKEVDYKNSTSSLLYSPAKIVSDLSKVLTLNPGDIISSGTSKSFPAKGGDIIKINVEGLGGFNSKVVNVSN